ncbi:hypothetical protein PoB_004686700 [Plakobranchus ocellatus]|uniref:Uncharacterized protein n=1 Tax=Plakobranchus ocellatus TaxID=259542 RepID=A0AAV4BLY7_9GAST|nr:hypothetical protein PoB_004686700 [Plakobranchus ocellatus]
MSCICLLHTTIDFWICSCAQNVFNAHWDQITVTVRDDAIVHRSSNDPIDPMLAKKGDLKLSGSPSSQGAGVGARTRVRRIPPDLRTDSLSTVPPTLSYNLSTNGRVKLLLVRHLVPAPDMRSQAEFMDKTYLVKADFTYDFRLTVALKLPMFEYGI